MNTTRKFGEFTPEERKENILKAKTAQVAKYTAYKENEHLLKLDWIDAPLWDELSTKYKVRLPHYNEPCTLPRMRVYLKRSKIGEPIFKEHYTSLHYFLENNPKVPLVAFIGMVLELREAYSPIVVKQKKGRK